MKLFNIFKKETKKEIANVKKLEKSQLEQVVGGTETTKTPVAIGNVDTAINLRL